MEMPEYIVGRYRIEGGDPDHLEVLLDGCVILDVSMGPGGPLHPESADAAGIRPWFFSGSPFGEEIVALARCRGVIP